MSEKRIEDLIGDALAYASHTPGCGLRLAPASKEGTAAVRWPCTCGLQKVLDEWHRTRKILPMPELPSSKQRFSAIPVKLWYEGVHAEFVVIEQYQALKTEYKRLRAMVKELGGDPDAGR